MRLTRGQYLRRQRVLFAASQHRWETKVRYRIQISPLLGSTLCVVSTYDDFGSVLRIASKMYTIDEEFGPHGGLVEILGQLQRLVGESDA